MTNQLPLQEIIARLAIPDSPTYDHSQGFWTGLGTMQELNQKLIGRSVLDFINYNLRGIGQVIFVNNPLSGLLILVALFIQSPWVGWMSLLGVASSTVMAIALKLDQDNIRNGIFGYDGLLVGAALATFGSGGNGDWNLSWAIAIAVLAASTTVMKKYFGVWWASTFNSPPLTIPFNIATLLFLALVISIPQSWFQLGTTAASETTIFNLTQLLVASPSNFGQVFLADKLIASSLIILGVFICTPLGAIIGLVGAGLGMTTALLLGIVHLDAIYSGLWGYNSILAAMALGGIFFAPNLRSFIAGAGCAFLAALAIPLLSLITQPLSLPVLSLPFCLVAIGFIALSRRSLPSLVPVALHAVTSPEEHRQRYLIAKDIIGNFRRQLEIAISGQGRNFLFDKTSSGLKGDLRYVFDAIDTDGNGELSTDELASYLTQADPSMTGNELNYLFKCMDRDRNGSIDFAEFGELILRHRRLMAKHDAFMTYFLPIDADEDDRISIDEMNLAMNSVGEAKLSPAEINFLQQRANSQSFTWNQFIELLLLT